LSFRAEAAGAKNPGSLRSNFHHGRLQREPPVYFEEFGVISEAIGRGNEIKQKMTWARNIRLIESINPQWKDPSEQWKEGIRDSPVARALREPDRGMTEWRPPRSAPFSHSRASVSEANTGRESRVRGSGNPGPLALRACSALE